jgi:hypothetical protein
VGKGDSDGLLLQWRHMISAIRFDLVEAQVLSEQVEC